jgi:hypothetical protein
LRSRTDGQSDRDDTQQDRPSNHFVTVIAALPLLPSLVAVIVAVPFFLPVTTPDCETVAIAVSLEDHAIARPVSTLPLASFVAAASVTVASSATVAVAGVTVTVATGARPTLTVDVPLFVSLVAVIVADP